MQLLILTNWLWKELYLEARGLANGAEVNLKSMEIESW